MKWLNQIPLLRLIIPFCIGIMISFYYPYPFSGYQWGIVGCFTLVILSFNRLKSIRSIFSNRWVFGITSSLFFITLGYTLANSKVERFTSNHYTHFTEESNKTGYKAIVIAEIEEKKNSIKTVVEIVEYHSEDTTIATNGKVIVYFKKNIEVALKYGDVILFTKQPTAISSPANFDEFDYQRYLSHHHIYDRLYLQNHEFKVIGFEPKSILKSLAIGWRSNLLNRYTQFGIKGEELAIISALTLGKKESLTAELKSAYASAGAMHVLAVSGLHVGIIYLVLRLLLSWMDTYKNGSRIKSVILIFVIWLYAIITGLSPSVIRAATMFSFMILAVSFKRNSNIYNTLALSAFAILIYNPFLLLEVGFQLSYLAVFGIIYLHTHLYTLFVFKPWLLNKAWEITCVSISAQIVTAPLGILYFHQFPTYFLFSNLIVIPAAFFIIFNAVSLQLLWFIPWLGETLAWTLLQSVKLLNFLVKWIDKLPQSLIYGLDISVFETWIIYLALATLSIWLIQYKNEFFIYALFLSVLLVSSQTTEKWNQLNQSEITFYTAQREQVIEFVNGYHRDWAADSNILNNEERMLFHVYHHSWKRGLSSSKSSTTNYWEAKNAMGFGDITLLKIDTKTPFYPSQIERLKPNIIYVDTYKYWDIQKIKPYLKNQVLIVGMKSSKRVKEEFRNICDSLQLPFYSLDRTGAIKIKLNSQLTNINSITHQKPH
ncbi:MAG: competence protein ComEC [Salibacteraceae bacterium]|jgi:competence protein ComEC